MGQGIRTGFGTVVADELGADLARVKVLQAPGNQAKFGNQDTDGSRSMRHHFLPLRRIAAATRQMLAEEAAAKWGVPVTEVKAENHGMVHGPSNRRLEFGALAKGAAARPVPPQDKLVLKPVSEFRYIGKDVPLIDNMDITTGKAAFGIDARVDGMAYAVVARSPVFGGKVKSFDATKVESMKGVKKVVPVGDNAVAVVADTWWHAKTALDALPIVWDAGENAKVSSESIAKWLKEGLDADQAFVGNKNGDAKAGLSGAAKKVVAEYSYPYQNHACMEPLNATALYTPDKCEVWCGTQHGQAAFAAALEASGLPASKVEVYKYMLGGGFGRRGRSDYVTQAVLIAKQMPGTPIKLLWSREEDMQQGTYHPITQCRLTAGLDDKGNLNTLHVRISGQSILTALRPEALVNGMDPATFQGLNASGEAAIGYSVPNLLIEHAMRNPHVPPGFWRGVNVNQNAIYLESFMDELAKETGVDPLEFRRRLMANHPKHLSVLNAVAERIGWGKPAPAGQFRGLAQFMGYGSYVTGAAEVSVDNNKVKVHRIVAVTDPGYAVNPAQIERQICGSFVYGLSALFYGECTVKDGAIEQTNFDTYDSMRIAQMPKVECIVMPTGGFWGGVGEPTICVAPPAVLNAIFAATGKRYRSVPLKNHGLSLA